MEVKRIKEIFQESNRSERYALECKLMIIEGQIDALTKVKDKVSSEFSGVHKEFENEIGVLMLQKDALSILLRKIKLDL